MTTEKSKTVAFSGHRSNRITTETGKLTEQLDKTLEELYLRGYRTFLSGMTEGFDLLSAEAVLKLRTIHNDIRLICVLPFSRQASRYSEEDKHRYGVIFHDCDEHVTISDRYFEGCFHRRNDFLADNSSLLAAYYDDTPRGGTFYTVSRAIKQDMKVINLAQKEALDFGIKGDGITVWDRKREDEHDYIVVARIEHSRRVTFHDANLSLTARWQIERFARYDNMFRASEPGNYALDPLPKQ